MNIKTDMKAWMKGMKSKIAAGMTAFGLVAMTLAPIGVSAATVNLFSDSFGSASSNTVSGWTETETASDYARIETSTSRPGSPTHGHARITKEASIQKTVSTVGYDTIKLSYYWRGDSQAESSDHLRVYWRSLPDGVFQEVASSSLNVTSWSSQVLISLPATAGNGSIEIKFFAETSADDEDARIDDVLVTGNHTPTANNTSATTDEDMAAAVTLTGADTDGDTLFFSTTSNPMHGVLSGVAPNLTYTPDENYNGSDAFTFIANDGTAYSGVATATITINPVNDMPAAGDDSYNTNEDMMVVTGNVLTNDTDIDGDTLSVSAADTTSVNGGTVLNNTDGTFSYTPAAEFSGSDSFTYTVSDGALTDTGTVTIVVSSENDAPVAGNDEYTTDEDTALVVPAAGVLGNDSDVESNPITAVLVDDVAHGTLALASDGGFSYTPDENYNGEDTFSYQANDGSANSGTAVVTITVNPVNDVPAVGALEVVTNEDTATSSVLVANDVDSESVSFATTSSPMHGMLLGFDSGTGVFSYVPDMNYHGTDSFDFLASDGEANSATGTVMITVNSVNDAPTISLNGSSTVNLTVGDPYVEQGAAGSDVDGDELTSSTTGSVDTGTVGTTTLIYTVSDGEFSASTTREVIVSPASTPTTTPESTPAPSPAPAPENGGGNTTSGGSGFVNPVSTTTATTTTGTTPNTTGTTSPFIFGGNTTGSQNQNQNQNRNGNSTGANANSTTSPLVAAPTGGNATGTDATATTTDEFSTTTATTTDGNGSNTGDNPDTLAAAGLLGGLGNLPWWSWLLLILIALGLWGVFREKDAQ